MTTPAEIIERTLAKIGGQINTAGEVTKAVLADLAAARLAIVPMDLTLEMQHAYFGVIDPNLALGLAKMAGRYDIQHAAYAAMLRAAQEPKP